MSDGKTKRDFGLGRRVDQNVGGRKCQSHDESGPVRVGRHTLSLNGGECLCVDSQETHELHRFRCVVGTPTSPDPRSGDSGTWYRRGRETGSRVGTCRTVSPLCCRYEGDPRVHGPRRVIFRSFSVLTHRFTHVRSPVDSPDIPGVKPPVTLVGESRFTLRPSWYCRRTPTTGQTPFSGVPPILLEG